MPTPQPTANPLSPINPQPFRKPPRPGRLLAVFEVLGIKPIPWAWGPGGYRNGREARAGIPNEPLRQYQAAIRKAALAARLDPEVCLGPIEIQLTFSDYAPEGASDGDWRLKPLVWNEARRRHEPATRQESDATNEQKVFEDACAGILYANDVQVVRITTEKRWATWQGVHAVVREASQTQ